MDVFYMARFEARARLATWVMRRERLFVRWQIADISRGQSAINRESCIRTLLLAYQLANVWNSLTQLEFVSQAQWFCLRRTVKHSPVVRLNDEHKVTFREGLSDCEGEYSWHSQDVAQKAQRNGASALLHSLSSIPRYPITSSHVWHLLEAHCSSTSSGMSHLTQKTARNPRSADCLPISAGINRRDANWIGVNYQIKNPDAVQRPALTE